MTRHTEKHISCSYELQNGCPWWVHIHKSIQGLKLLLSFDFWGLLPLKEIFCLWLAHVITRKWMSHGRCFMWVYKWHRSHLLVFYWPDTVYGYSTVWEAGKCTPALFLYNRRNIFLWTCNNQVLIIETL